MSYLALARKWRPRTFSELVGQEHITKALSNALSQQRLHHAYLFTGTRGVGKTSVARILAKALNCEQGITPKPCLSCDACIAIGQGRFIDLIEIDGASTTRVEDIRELLDNVQYASTNARFKIYLIDEVHMLSQHSFNALLKTLEEPPAHVKFILATTDPQKLPITVLSRCLQFHLKHLASELISQQLGLILKEENISFEQEAIQILAHAAKGSMRDGLSLLDNAINMGGSHLQTQDVKLILGFTKEDYALSLLQALAAEDPKPILHLTQDIETQGGHFDYVLDEILHYLHQMAVYLCLFDANALISPALEIKALASQFLAEDIQLLYQIAIKGREEMHLAPTLSIGFSMTMLRMLLFRPAPSPDLPPLAFQNKSRDSLPAKSSQDKANTSLLNLESPDKKAGQEALQYHDTQLFKEPFVPVSMPLSLPDKNAGQGHKHGHELSTEKSNIAFGDINWPRLISELKLTGLAQNAIENSEFISQEGRTVTLSVSKTHQSLFTPNTILKIEAALAQYFQNPIRLSLNTKETVNATPRQQKEKMIQDKQQKAEEALFNDPCFQQIKQEFSAEVVKNSIVLLEDEL